MGKKRNQKELAEKYDVSIEQWNKYLDETEEEAFPYFLEPNVHPDGFCMPCCNKKPYVNYSKCFIIDINCSIENDYDLKKIKEGYELNKYKFKA